MADVPIALAELGPQEAVEGGDDIVANQCWQIPPRAHRTGTNATALA